MRKKWKIIVSAFACGMILMSGTSSIAADNILDISCASAGITETGEGDYLVTDIYHKVIWNIQDGKGTIYAGVPGVEGLYGEPEGGYRDDFLKQALFGRPWAIVPFQGGYAVSDPPNHVIRLLQENKVRTINLNMKLSNPTGLAVDDEGSLYIADTNNGVIRKVTAGGEVSDWISGLLEPTGLYYQNGSLYIADSGNNRILKSEDGNITSVIGGAGSGYADGDLQQALFANPMGIAVDDRGIIYVADTGNSAVRKIQGDKVSTLLINKGDGSENIPVSPVGLFIKNGTVYLCDTFSRIVLAVPENQEADK